jgi:riboflavin kinase/FMN adenylyltransferase
MSGQADFFMDVLWLNQLDNPFDEKTVVCLGMFDGVHIGHQALILEGLRVAKERQWALCIHTYDILPINFIHQNEKVAELTPISEKLKLFEMHQADIVAIDRFNDELLHMTGHAFFNDIVAGKMNAGHVVVGFDHRFGYRADSGTNELEKFCQEHGIGLSIIPAVKTESGEVISSTAIRKAISTDDLDLASRMLGRTVDAAMIEQVKGV